MSDRAPHGPAIGNMRLPYASEPAQAQSLEERFNRIKLGGGRREIRSDVPIKPTLSEASYSSPSLPSYPPPLPPSSANAYSTRRAYSPSRNQPSGPRDLPSQTAHSETNAHDTNSKYSGSTSQFLLSSLPSVPTSLPSAATSKSGLNNDDRGSGLRRSSHIKHLSFLAANDTSASTASPPPRPSSSSRTTAYNFPRSVSVSVDQLATYIHEIPDQILLLDVRPREKFDEGHIYASYIVNIDPIILRRNQTGLDLEDALIVSPSKEQEAFGRRHTFELVVFFDQSSTAAENAALRDLFDTIYEREPVKSLKRQPVLLVGGVNAWIDYCGLNSLVSTKPNRPTDDVKDQKSNVYDGPDEKITMSYEQDYNRSQKRLPPSPNYGDRRASPVRYPATTDNRALSQFSSGHHIYNSNQSTQSLMSVEKPQLPDLSRDVNDFFRKGPTTPSDLMPKRPTPVVGRISYNGRISSHSMPVAGSNIPSITQDEISSQLVRRTSQSLDAMTSFPQSPAVTRSDKQHSIGNSFSGLGEVSAGLTGLKNLGNTCYMNSIIQCLAGTNLLARFFLTGSYKKYINIRNKLGSKGELTLAFGNLVWSLYNDQCTFLIPTTMKELVGRLSPEFAGNDQHDAQEFLTFILDGLHEDLNSNGGKPRLPPLTEQEERMREKYTVRYASFLEWERYLKSDNSAIVNMFQGQYQSRLSCMVCGFTSTTYNPFSFLSLPLAPGRTVSLEQCFDLFVAEEVLDNDDAWFCPQCKQQQRATKALRISRLPVVLIIHLKRFKTNGRWSNKLDSFVNFPMHGLDLTQYWPDYRSEDKVWLDKYPQAADQRKPFEYNLYGVVNHYGSLRGGHYTSYVHKNNKGWLVFDDSRVAKCPREKVVSRDAYVLFYERDLSKVMQSS